MTSISSDVAPAVGEPLPAGRVPLDAFARKRPNDRLDMVFGTAAQVLQMGAGLILLPFVVATLTPAEVGFWYVFMTIQALAYLVDFGFVPTFSRNFNYVFAGASRLNSEGLPEASREYISLQLLADLLSTSRLIYVVLAGVTGGILAVFGSIYVANLAETAPGIDIWTPWVIFVAALFGHTFFQWQMSVLIGANRIRATYEVSIVSRGVQVVASLVGLVIWPSLTTLTICYAISAVVMRLHLHWLMRDVLRAAAPFPSSRRDSFAMLKVLWRNTWRYGTVLLATFLASRFNMLVVAWFYGLEISGHYAVASQAYAAVVAFALVLAHLKMPTLVNGKVQGDGDLVRRMLSAGLVFYAVTFVCGSIALMTVGAMLLSLVRETAVLPANHIMILLAVAYFLDGILNLSTSVISAGNRIPFLAAYVVTGVVIAAGGVLVGLSGLDLGVLILLQIAAQLAYNAWRWPREAVHETSLRLRDVPRMAVAEIVAMLRGHRH